MKVFGLVEMEIEREEMVVEGQEELAGQLEGYKLDSEEVLEGSRVG